MKRFFALLLAMCLVLPLTTGVSAAGEKQHDYSTTANSGIRHETCTSLLGTTADSYYTGDYTYGALSELDADELLITLRVLMTDTHTKKSTYDDCHYKANKTDCENADGESISLIYTSYSATQSDWCNSRSQGWNREHVWPKSLGGFTEKQAPGCDLHHVRPSDQPVNSTRGNLKYGNVTGGKTVTGAAYTGKAVGGTSGGGYFEPLDNVKGDVARICLYVYVRYGSEYSKCASITNVFQSVDVLLEWCALDPVDTWEMGRNEVVAACQGNRNVFIDYPELAWLLFDEEIPSDMVTPSGEAAASAPCTHSSATVKNVSAATCTENGYTGDTYCADCGEKLSGGSAIPATGHTNENSDAQCDTCGQAVDCGHGETESRNVLDATCGAEGYTGDTHCTYCDTLLTVGETIPATGDHAYGDWTVTEEATTEGPGTRERSCTVCGLSETEDIPQLEPPVTQPPVTEPDPTAPTSTEPSATAPSEPGPQEDDDSAVLWIVICAVGAVGCAIAAVILLSDKKKK